MIPICEISLKIRVSVLLIFMALVFQFKNAIKPFITLLLVPVIYAIFVLDLKLVKWEKVKETPEAEPATAS